MKNSNNKKILKILKIILLIFLAFLFIFPLLWMLITSFKTSQDISSGAFFPSGFSLEGYKTAIQSTDLILYYFNSIVVAVSVTIGQVFISFLAGYGFARFKFKGRKIAFILFVSTLIIPYQLLILPIFVILKNFHLINTYAALIIPSLANAFGIFLFKQHFETIPRAVEEVAEIDGASRWTILWKILLPMSKAPIITLSIITFVAEWNDLFKPLVFVSDEKLKTLQYGLTVFQEQFKGNFPILMSAVVLAVIPVLVIFILAQKHLIRGVKKSRIGNADGLK